ncbi:hypothetical protein ACFYJ0_07185, partial [Streptococcus pyogenes]
KEAKQMIDLKRNLFKIDVRAQKDEEKVFMRTAWASFLSALNLFPNLWYDKKMMKKEILKELF